MHHLAQDGVVTLREFHPIWPLLPAELPPTAVNAAIVDTETTGVDESATVIEVAVLPFIFDGETGALLAVLPALGGLQDPGFPIPAEASAVNGITDEDVRGRSINWPDVAELLAACDLLIAHNAGFDRPKVTREIVSRRGDIPDETVDRVVDGLWACSLQQLPWDAPARRQEVLAWWHGFYYSAHRATGDCEALLHLLDVSGKLGELWRAARTPSWEVWAVGSPFATKDLLKSRGYRWHADSKTWFRGLNTEAEVQDEQQWLGANIYGQGTNRAQVKKIEPHSRYR